MPDLLVMQEVTAGYEDTVILEAVSLHLEHAQAMALLGRNGVGKSTLLATLMGLTVLRAGQVRFQQQDLAGIDVHERVSLGMGFVPQEREIFPSLTVEENLKVSLRPGAWTRERVYDLFPRLAERRRHYGNQLSGGEQQMLAIGRALLANPALLLLDEPFEGLAPILIEALVQAVVRLRKESELAVILVEQHSELALQLTETTVVLDRGQVAWRGPSSELAKDAAKLETLIGLNEGHDQPLSTS